MHSPPTLLQADALKAKFRDYAKAIAETKGTMADDTKDAFFSLTQAEYAAGDFKKAVLEGNMVAQVRVTSAVDNVAGVKLPVFNLQETGAVNDNQTLGLVGGGKKVSWLNSFWSLLVSSPNLLHPPLPPSHHHLRSRHPGIASGENGQK